MLLKFLQLPKNIYIYIYMPPWTERQKQKEEMKEIRWTTEIL